MSFFEVALPVSVYVVLSTFINSFLAPFWPPVAVLSTLASLAVFFMARESRAGVVLGIVVLLGTVADVFSYAPFGTHLLYTAVLFLFAGLWVDIFSSTMASIIGFLCLVPVIDYFFARFISFLSNVAGYGSGLFFVLTLSIPLNIALYVAYVSVMPLRKTEDVE